jgi:dTDP-glucose pyrophosphorylase/CBS domain-containing protein
MTWRDTLIHTDASILDAFDVINRGGMQIALVIDDEEHLLGIVTDGDLRRNILAMVEKDLANLQRPVREVMNATPTVATPSDDRQRILGQMRARKIHQIPVVDHEFRVVGLITLDSLLEVPGRSNLVVLMAGGFGTRLRPLTEDTPKPMLRVGNRPILETIMQQFLDYGFSRFAVSVHYKAEVIKQYFGDGRRLGADISYIEETRPMGTAGALALLPTPPSEPFFVMNGDLLTKLNFANLLEFHRENGSDLTICVREHKLSVPYGVAEVEGNYLQDLVEKPTYRKMVNAGIYVCNPSVLEHFTPGQPTTMVDLAHALLKQGRPPAVFTINEYWVDIGQHADFDQARADYENFFG